MKAQLACDVDYDKVKWPVYLQPKIDGVRALVVDGKLVGRSGKRFRSTANNRLFDRPELSGMDGEMVRGSETSPNLCGDTTSALSSFNGQTCRWYVFDDFSEPDLPYFERLDNLIKRVRALPFDLKDVISVVETYAEVYRDCEVTLRKEMVDEGYEGTILRDPSAPYKFGKCTPKEANFFKVKSFHDAEVRVTKLLEGQTNHNELTHSPIGKAERSTKKAGLVPSGLLGGLVGELVEPLELHEKTLPIGTALIISPGKLTHQQRAEMWADPTLVIGKLVKFQYFKHGAKDKPRFPTFQCFRVEEDLCQS